MRQVDARKDLGRGGVLALVAALLLAIPGETKAAMENVKIVYIEASTGNRWKLPEFPQRVGESRFQLRFLAEYDFDKTRLVRQALDGEGGKPDAVVLQECAVYFPGQMEQYKATYRGWIEQIRAAGVRPVIATVVPPAHGRGVVRQARDFVKAWVLGRPRQDDQVRDFNDWLRGLAAEMKVAILDLEQAIRISDEDRHMKGEYDVGDGIHLNPRAYGELDALLLRTLRQIDWGG